MQFIFFSEILLDYLWVCFPKYSIEYLTFWEILEKKLSNRPYINFVSPIPFLGLRNPAADADSE